MIFRWPLVRPNQRVIPLDFERLTAAAEDLIAHIAQHVLVDTTDATYKDMGIVLWGLAASSVNGNPATVTVSPGAALVPNNGGDSRWRLVYLTGTYTAHLDAPGAGTRTDLIRIKLDPATEDAGSAEERDYR